MSKKTIVPTIKIEAANGITIIIKEDHSTPIVSFCAYFPGGPIFEKTTEMGLTHLMQRLLIKGTGEQSAEEIAREIEFLGAHLAPFTGKESFGVSMSAVSRHFNRGVEIFADCIVNPRFDVKELAREKKNILQEIEKRKDDTLSHCLELCEEKLFDNNPYGFTIIGKKDSVRRITVEDIIRWHRTFYSPRRMIISLVGDVKTEVVLKKFMEVFKGFASHNDTLPEESFSHPQRTKAMIKKEREKKQVAISLGFFAPPLDSAEYFSFKVLDYLLSGMGSRLFINLRDIQGLAYLVSCTYMPRKRSGSFKAYMQTSSDKRERALAGLIKELNELCSEVPPKGEVERVKKYMLGLNEIALQKKWAQASKLAFYELMGLGYDFVERYPEKIKRVTATQVRKVAQSYIDTEKSTCAMIVPKD